MRMIWLLLAALLAGCGQSETPPPQPALPEPTWQAGTVDTVGARNLAEGDTTSGERGLVIIETTRTFGDGEAIGWEFNAVQIRPVKLIIVRADASGEQFELVGESETVVPRQKGLNRFALPEPIPVSRGSMLGLVVPEEEAIPFTKVMNWRTLITTHRLERPFMRRDYFASYGWRYSVRVLWRPTAAGVAGQP